MNVYPNITVTASLIADPTRSIFLSSLLDGRALPAGELAHMARVTPQTASSHLAKLVEGGLLEVEKQGRHRYYRLANREIASLIEMMANIAPPAQIRSLRQSEQLKQLRLARTCYGHLAGKLGVALCESFLQKGYLLEPEETHDKDYRITEEGIRWFSAFGIELQPNLKTRRAIARKCLDWSERKHHLSGLLAEQLVGRFVEMGWIHLKTGSRSVEVTESGKRGLDEVLGISL